MKLETQKEKYVIDLLEKEIVFGSEHQKAGNRYFTHWVFFDFRIK